ncbi:unnamed protein product, partial [Ectocarpus sp. 4 AP-2014]
MDSSRKVHDDGVHEIFVPGRLCVLGEHTDWAAGYRDRNRAVPPGFTVVATTREGLHARVQARADGRLTFKAGCPDASTAGEGGGDGIAGGDGQTAASAASGGAVGANDGVSTLDVALTEE